MLRQLCLGILIVSLISIGVSATTYYVDINATISKITYGPSEDVGVYGSLLRGDINGSNVTNSSTIANASILINITTANLTLVSSQTLNTTSQGLFYSRSTTFSNASVLSAPNTTGNYFIIISYTDPNATVWIRWLSFAVTQFVIDDIRVMTNKATYIAGERGLITGSAFRNIGAIPIAQSNITLLGTLRNLTSGILDSFNCTTGSAGTCTMNLSVPATAGSYRVEVNNYTSSTIFSVVPFDAFVYTKDSSGTLLKNSFKRNDQVGVEVHVSYNGTVPTGTYTFTGNVTDVNGNVLTTINSTTLESNNSYVNRASFTLDNTYGDGFYTVSVIVTQTGGSSVITSAVFQVRNWNILVQPTEQGSGFEYGLSAFANKSVLLDILPTDSTNGTAISGINTSFITVNIKDALGITQTTGNITWNSTCRRNGCYRANFITPATPGAYRLVAQVDYSGEIQEVAQPLQILNLKLEAVPTNENGDLKELFGTNEFVYVTLVGKDLNGTSIPIIDAELKTVTYSNGSTVPYTNVSYFAVNASNTQYEYGYNVSSQRLRLDTPNAGGSYTVELYANNRTVVARTNIIINPFDTCIVTKNTAGQVSVGYYYVSQFRTDDTIYFELTAKQATNPLGRAPSLNSSNNSYGRGTACVIDSSRDQVVANATVSIVEAFNINIGSRVTLNTTTSVCQADTTQGKYSCTLQQETNKWPAGSYKITLKIDNAGITGVAYGSFEARAFYLYAYSQSWRRKPIDDINLTVNMYQAGSNWWGSGSGLSGTVTVERIEFCGGDGYWLASCVDTGYNTTGMNASTITSGTGILSLSVNRTTANRWSSGGHKVVLRATDSSGTTDYGYAWFDIRQWEAWGNPIGLSGGTCAYKNSFGSKEGASLYVRITNAGDWNDNGNSALGGAITISFKKLQDASSWPPKEINLSLYNTTSFTTSVSSPNYWLQCNSSFVLNITPVAGRWNSTGYFNAILDINGTETGYAWFQVKSFNVYTEPTTANGTGYVYSTNGRGPVYFNTYATKGEKSVSQYVATDFVNTTVYDAVLRYWDQNTRQTIEMNYPENINLTLVNKTGFGMNGTAIVNITRPGANWQSGYYWGELFLNDSEGQLSRGYMYFNVQPFRVTAQSNQYEISATSQFNTTLNVYSPDWSNNALLTGNYTITSVYEDVWSYGGSTRTTYNVTPTLFNNTVNITITPANGRWNNSGGYGYGGYHYLTIVVKDSDNTSQQGWISLRAIPFRVTLGVLNNVRTTQNVTVPVTIQDALTSANVTGNLTRVYRWGNNGQQTFGFAVGNCTSATSSTCAINGTANVTLIVPSGGWDETYNYLNLIFSDGATTVESNTNFRAVQTYSGMWSNQNSTGAWSYNVDLTEDATVKLEVRDANNNAVNLTVYAVDYSPPSTNCWSESCRVYTSAAWSLSNGGTLCNSTCFIRVTNPGIWQKGQYTLRATVNGTLGNATIKDGYFYSKNLTAPTLNLSSPVQNITYNRTFNFNATTSKTATCSINMYNQALYKSWFCGSNVTGTCNSTLYNGTTYYYKYAARDYSYISRNSSGAGTSQYGTTGLNTGGTTHSYTLPSDTLASQYYVFGVWCYDEDWNGVNQYIPIYINASGNS